AAADERLERVGAARYGFMAGFVEIPGNDAGMQGRMSPEIGAETARGYLDAVASARSRAAAWASGGGPPGPLTLYLHSRPESLAGCTGTAALSWRNPLKGVVHALCSAGVPDDAGLEAARGACEQALGPPSREWIADGAALHAA